MKQDSHNVSSCNEVIFYISLIIYKDTKSIIISCCPDCIKGCFSSLHQQKLYTVDQIGEISKVIYGVQVENMFLNITNLKHYLIINILVLFHNASWD